MRSSNAGSPALEKNEVWDGTPILILRGGGASRHEKLKPSGPVDDARPESNLVFALGARSLSLHTLTRAGATRLWSGGWLRSDGEQVAFDGTTPANVAAGDAFAARARGMVDEIIQRLALDAPPAEPDDADVPVDLHPPIALDLRASTVGSVVWCTRFTGDFSWLDSALVDDWENSCTRTSPPLYPASGMSGCAGSAAAAPASCPASPRMPRRSPTPSEPN